MTENRTLSLSCAFGAGILTALALSFFVVSATAQTGRGDPDWVNPDVIALRDEVELLRREIARLQAGAAVNGGGAVGGGVPSGDYFVRLEALEAEARRLIGQMERLSFETSRAIEARDAQIAELYGRIATLEAALGVTPPPSSAPQPGTAPGLGGGGGPSGGAVVAPTPGAGGGPGTLGTLPSTAGDALVIDQPNFENGGGGGAAVAATPLAPQPEAPTAAPTPATYEEALEYLRARNLESAEAALLGFISANPSDPRIGEATYWLGETYYMRGEYGDAAKAFLSSFRDHPTGSKAPDSLLRLGVTLAQLGKKPEACASLEQVSVRYPDAPQTLLRRAQVEARRAGCS